MSSASWIILVCLTLCWLTCHAKHVQKKHKDLSFGQGNASKRVKSGSAAVSVSSSKSGCERLVCGAGRRCSALPDGSGTCVCVSSCPEDHVKPVCGSDGVSYQNHCFLHRAACVHGKHISIYRDGPCPAHSHIAPSTQPPPAKPVSSAISPVVCFQEERDRLRALLIDWLQDRAVAGSSGRRGKKHGHHTGGGSKKAYRRTLRTQFLDCDVDGGGTVSSEELLACLEVERRDNAGHGADIAKAGHSSPRTAEILRGLCIDALIDVADMNQDWRLTFKEFKHLMNPHFIPPAKKCSLEDRHYEDGAETKVDCNTCVCACGHWVCTATACDGGDTDTTAPTQRHVKEPHHHRTATELEADILDNSKWEEMMRKFKAFTAENKGGGDSDGKRGRVHSVNADHDTADQKDTRRQGMTRAERKKHKHHGKQHKHHGKQHNKPHHQHKKRSHKQRDKLIE